VIISLVLAGMIFSLMLAGIIIYLVLARGITKYQNDNFSCVSSIFRSRKEVMTLLWALTIKAKSNSAQTLIKCSLPLQKGR
jgi:hypothetical protein